MARDKKQQQEEKPVYQLAPTPPRTPPSDGRCFWDKLPAELKDIIFEMAYVPIKPMKPLSKTMWTWREAPLRQKQGEDYWRFLVSREWCSAAVKVFYKHAEFYLEDDDILYHFLVDGNKDGWPRPYAEHITSIVVPIAIDSDEDSGWAGSPAADVTVQCLVRVVDACPALTRLKIRCTYDQFQEDLRYLEDANHSGEVDLDALYQVNAHTKLYGILHLTVEPIMQEEFDCPNDGSGVWRCKDCRKRPYVDDTNDGVKKSFRIIENLLRSKVARPSPDNATEEENWSTGRGQF